MRWHVIFIQCKPCRQLRLFAASCNDGKQSTAATKLKGERRHNNKRFLASTNVIWPFDLLFVIFVHAHSVPKKEYNVLARHQA